jgi:ubiquinone/menaquinone biosynthesis C-methylase UbiE
MNVLDVGCGTGLWAIEFAEEHPSAKVLGTDLRYGKISMILLSAHH